LANVKKVDIQKRVVRVALVAPSIAHKIHAHLSRPNILIISTPEILYSKGHSSLDHDGRVDESTINFVEKEFYYFVGRSSGQMAYFS